MTNPAPPPSTADSSPPAWYEKYKIDYGQGVLPPNVTVFDFSSVKSIPPDEWAAIQEAERRELAARPKALAEAERALYKRVNMPLIPLRDGTRIPAVGLGTWKAERGQVKAAVHVALQAGYRHIDCASVYQNEDEVGEALEYVLSRDLVSRDELYICSKVWNNDHAPDRVRAACLRSLKALRLDYLDLYLIHWPVTGNVGDDVKPSIRDTWQALEGLVRDGLVRSIGTSNFSAKKLSEIMEYAEIQPSVCQVEIHPYHRNDALIAWCAARSIHVTAFSPLGSPDSESIFPRKVPAVLLKDPIVQRIASKTGHNVGQVLVRWALQHGTSVIPKSTNPDRIRGNLDVLDWELSPQDFTALSTLRFQQRMVNGAMWLNPRGPYKTMEDLWDEPELIPEEDDVGCELPNQDGDEVAEARAFEEEKKVERDEGRGDSVGVISEEETSVEVKKKSSGGDGDGDGSTIAGALRVEGGAALSHPIVVKSKQGSPRKSKSPRKGGKKGGSDEYEHEDTRGGGGGGGGWGGKLSTWLSGKRG